MNPPGELIHPRIPMLAGRMVECQVDSTVALTYIANRGRRDPQALMPINTACSSY